MRRNDGDHPIKIFLSRSLSKCRTVTEQARSAQPRQRCGDFPPGYHPRSRLWPHSCCLSSWCGCTSGRNLARTIILNGSRRISLYRGPSKLAACPWMIRAGRSSARSLSNGSGGGDLVPVPTALHQGKQLGVDTECAFAAPFTSEKSEAGLARTVKALGGGASAGRAIRAGVGTSARCRCRHGEQILDGWRGHRVVSQGRGVEDADNKCSASRQRIWACNQSCQFSSNVWPSATCGMWVRRICCALAKDLKASFVCPSCCCAKARIENARASR